MAAAPVTAEDRTSRAALPATIRPPRRPATVPALEARHRPAAARLAEAFPTGHPVWIFLAAALLGYVLLAALTVSFGLLLTHIVLRDDAVARADERLPAWFAAHRAASLTDGSLIGSIGAGGVVVPILVGLTVVALACAKCWRIAAFLFTAIAVEVSTYRVTTMLVHRDRPSVPRLERLPVDASYPSGHTAAAIAVYCGLTLLITSRFRSTRLRVACWSVAVLIPVLVATARMYRGMHHPLDVLAGGLMGLGALLVALFAARAAGFAARGREGVG